jgi:hypothetical protein
MNGTFTSDSAEPRHLDPDNPWPGLNAYEETARRFFKGRDAEAEELLRRVAEAPVTVLFGKSGLGKTSLLKAGLFPRLREQQFLPVFIRLDVRPAAPPLIDQMRAVFRATLVAERVDAPAIGENETLWEYLHRVDFELWSYQNYPLTPVLVCDQFEEIFTLGKRLSAEVQGFRLDFGDLAENRISPSLRERLDREDDSGRGMDLRTMRYKLIVSLREDFLPELEGWRRAIPTLGRVRVRLMSMNPDQALSAVYETASHLMDEVLGKRIVQFVAAEQMTQDESASTVPIDNGDEASAGEIEPALLSLFCRGLNERRKQSKKSRFDDELLEGSKQGIISDYYRSCIEGSPESVSRFIETELITEKGYRNSFAQEDAVPAHLTQEHLDRLIRRRLLRVEERQNAMRIELTHDVLTGTVRQHRDWRRAEEEKAQLEHRADEKRRAEMDQLEKIRLEAEVKAGVRLKRLAVGLALILIVTVAMAIAAVWQWQDAEKARAEAEVARTKAEEARAEAEEARAEAEEAKTEAEVARTKAEEARTEAEVARRVAEERTDALLKQFGWDSARLSRGSLDQYSVQQSLTANQDLQQAARLAPRESRKAVTVQYFPKDVDGNKVESALLELGFTFDKKRAPVSSIPTNSIWYGTPVSIEDVKLVALTLIRAGVQITAIRPFADNSPRKTAALIQVGADVAVANKAPLSVEGIRDASRFAR